MGVMKFRLPPTEALGGVPDFRKAYITGLDRTPGRLAVELRNGLMTCARDSTESGRLFVPWPIEGFGMPLVGTATLAERAAPYTLAVELARGKLNDIRNQLADWLQLGPAIDSRARPRRSAQPRERSSSPRPRRIAPDECVRAAQASLDAASAAGDLLMNAYTSQILQSRLSATSRLPTHFGCVIDETPRRKGRDRSTGPAVSTWPR